MNVFVSTALVALGSNLPQPEGDPAANLKKAIFEMAKADLVIRSVSRFFQTPCFPAGAGPDYVNAAVLLHTNHSASGLLDVLHGIENHMGRTRETRWGMRTLDLDLIAVDDRVMPDEETVRNWVDLPLKDQKLRAPDQLILPHPRLRERAFVLTPLGDIAPEWVHPLTGENISAMFDALSPADKAEVRPI